MNTKQFAKETRLDLKKAFPNFKFSVTSDYNSISVSIMSGDLDFGTTYESVNHFYISDNYKGEAKQMLQVINDLVQRHNYVTSEDSDYGSIPNYYFNLTIGKWDKPYKLN